MRFEAVNSGSSPWNLTKGSLVAVFSLAFGSAAGRCGAVAAPVAAVPVAAAPARAALRLPGPSAA